MLLYQYCTINTIIIYQNLVKSLIIYPNQINYNILYR